MIHSGAVVAAGVSQGRSTSLKRDFKVSVCSKFLCPVCVNSKQYYIELQSNFSFYFLASITSFRFRSFKILLFDGHELNASFICLKNRHSVGVFLSRKNV